MVMENADLSDSPNASKLAIDASPAFPIDSVAVGKTTPAQPVPHPQDTWPKTLTIVAEDTHASCKLASTAGTADGWVASRKQATSTNPETPESPPVSVEMGQSSYLRTNKNKPIVPEWFLQSKVRLAEDAPNPLSNHSKSVEGDVQTRSTACQDETGKETALSLENQEDRREVRDTRKQAEEKAPAPEVIVLNNDYEIQRDLYAEARDTILSGILRTPGNIHLSSNWTNTAAFLLQSPQDGSLGFSKAVVHTIAQELKADLVSLGQEDVHDLCQYFWPDLTIDSEGGAIFSSGTIGLFFEQDGEEEKKDDNSPPTRMDTFINTLLACPKTKTSSPAHRPPLIIHLSEVEDFIDSDEGLQAFFHKLLEAVKELRKRGETTIIVGTTVWDPEDYGYSTQWELNGEDEAPFVYGTVVNISPVATRRAKVTLDREIKGEPWSTQLRHLRRALRRSLGRQFQCDFLLPEALWELPDSTELEETLESWSNEIMGRLVRQIYARIALTCKVEPSEIFDIIARISRNKLALDMFKANPHGFDKDSTVEREDEKDEDEDEDDGKDEDEDEGQEDEVGEDGEDEGEGDENAKSKLNFRTFLENLSSSCTKEEKDLFDCVVDPDSLKSSFESIKLNQELIDRLRQLLSHSMTESEGLLATETVNGAILYGPPGTGKTHLARILAKEAAANFISINPADLERSLVGETEQLIKALFSLARKLHPCVVFLDEADALFGQRNSLDHKWERTSLSQFLVEIDGLRRSDQSPFVLVATNRPANLDDAVCRRLPHIVHIGLPGVDERKGIFAIFLKEERVDADVNLDDLASTHTRDFSGSDIRALCVQAAMIAQREVDLVKDDEVTDAPPKRVITRAHFLKALKYTRPTVSLKMLQEITKFSNQRRGSGLPF